ncbi:MAG: ABC transporter ATP-binding protein [Lachnospiraceae bacterium]|nr:ABC transporter ATP-binding protein [Lachnospiraceae bacterium]
MSNAVEVNNLVKRYKELLALDHFTLSIKEGEIFGLLGPNGSGKTTTMNCILSLLTYDKGDIKIFGEDMKPTKYNIKRDIGVVFQNVAVFDELTVYENIDYFCGLYIKDKKTRKEYVEDAIRFVGLEDYKKFHPKKLSGGLLRRLNIACGIAHKPKLIFFDEPTVAVDPQSRNKILEGIQELNANGATIVYTSHYMEEVEQICDRILIMDKGKSIAIGTNDELKQMIKNKETITIDVPGLTEENLKEIREIKHVYTVDYNDTTISIGFDGGRNNIVHIVNYLEERNIGFSKVHSQLPTLNDVFLEITGTELRD